jgi:surface antigen Omp85-like protein
MKRIFAKKLLLIALWLAAPIWVCAQHPHHYIPLKPPDSVAVKNPQDTIRQVDVGDLIKRLFHVQPAKKSDTVGLKPVISIVPALGYSLQSRLAILLAGNAAFRTGPESNISTIIASLAYTQNKQVTLPIASSIWSKDNNYDFVGLIRLYHYPQSTFGLGSNSDIGNEAPMDYNYLRFSEVALRKINGSFYVGAGYIIDYHTDITIQPTANGTVSEYLNYIPKNKVDEPKRHTTSSGFTLNWQYDTRDSPINPLSGFYSTLEFRQNLKTLGSTSTWSSVILDTRKYFRLPAGSNNVLALWSYDWLTISGKPPYLDLPSTLWDVNTNAGRGYIQGRFRGAQMVYGEAEYRFQVLKSGLLGGVVFINAQSFSAAPGTSLQSVQPGYGPGLRIKLNKVSKTNIDIDYGFGTQGSHGLFINVGEMF